MNETLTSIMNRRSTRIFLPEQIKDTEIETIIDTGIYAPSATNQQPWHFTVIQSKDIIDRLSSEFKTLAKNSDVEYLKKFGDNDAFHVFYHAPTVVLVSGNKSNQAAPVDCAAAVENMLIAAESMDIGSCWIGLIAFLLNSEQGEKFIKELGIPEGFKQFHAVAIGYKKNKSANALPRKENTVNYI